MSPLPNEPDPKLLALLEKLEPVALGITAIIAAGALLAWRLPAMAQLSPHWLDPRPPTAIALLFSSLSLWLATRPRSRLAQMIGRGIALGLVLAPFVAILGYAGVLPLAAARLGALPPPPTIAISLMSFLCMLWIGETRGIRSLVADLGAATTTAFTLFLIGGYVFGTIAFVGAVRVPLQSPATIVAIGLLAFVMLARRAVSGGIFRFLIADGSGSRVARAVLPAVVVTPFIVFQSINVLDRAGVSSIVLSQAIAAPLLVIATVTVIVWMGRYTNSIEGQLRRQSQTDELTGVLNQRGLESATAYLGRAALRDGQGLVAFFFDLDNLKRANDLLGHTAGSQIIQRFADLLAVTFRKTDIIARVGGDEFVVLAPAPIETAEEMLRRLARVVETLNASDHMPVPVSYSVGYAELRPGDGGDVDNLIAAADVRMYQEKSRKRAA